MLYRIIKLFLALLLSHGLLYCQSYYAKHYQVENGLSNNAVICSIQDRMGFLWFGTKDGLNRFDGYSFKIFRNDPTDTGSIGSNFIHYLYEDPGGTLWVGTERGLYRYDSSTEKFHVLKGTNDHLITEITSDKKGNLWFISGFTLFKYTAHSGKLQYYPVDQYFEATSICTTGDGTLWVASSRGILNKYLEANNSFSSYDVFHNSSKKTPRWIEKIHSTSNGFILIGTSNEGTKLFNPYTGNCTSLITHSWDKTELFVRNFVETEKNEIWIGTESGIYICNTQTGSITNLRKKYNDPFSLSDNAVYTFCKDKEGGIWAGTYFGGINYYPKQYTPFKKHFPRIGENSLSGNVVREIQQDQYGNIWIGTEDAGLNKLNKTTGKITHFSADNRPGSLSYSNIHGLLVDKNELWIGTFEHGLDVLNIHTGKVIRHYDGSPQSTMKSNFIYSIYKTKEEDILIGTTIGAYRYNRGKDEFEPLKGMPIYNWYTSLLKDEKGIIWAGTFGNGINYYNTQTGEGGNLRHNPTLSNSLASDRVNCVFEDSNHQLWFATEGGLCKYNRTNGTIKRYTAKEGFPSNFTISILEDDQKHLWISTTKGLVRFNPQTEKLKVFTIANGLLSDQFNFNSAYKDADGRMYFGSAKGLVSFHPNEFSKNSFVPPVYITGFQVFNKDLTIGSDGSPLKKSITYTNKLVLNYNQSTFSIDFAALSYTAPQMTEYAYKMEGMDKEWTYLKTNRKVYFTELAAGTYVFKVKASNGNGGWNEEETKLIIEILPPWWASWWAYMVYTLLIILLIAYIVHHYHQRTEEKNKRKIELLEAAKEKEIYEAKIEFFTNVAHEIRTPLTLIKGPLEKVMKKAAGVIDLGNSLTIMERNTNRLIDLTNQLLDFRQTEIKGFRLNFVKANITALLEETYVNFKPLAEQKNLRYELRVPQENLQAYVDVEALNKILYNLFGNAVKYASSEVHVALLPFAKEDTTFTVEVKNDGYLIPIDKKEKIFQPFFRLKETEKQKGTGIGLALARSLAELHKGVLDLKEPESNLNVFYLTLPVHQENEFHFYEEQPDATTITEENKA